jgi:hypothetical protein
MKRLPAILLFAICTFALIVPFSLKSSGNEGESRPKVVARFDHHFRSADLPTTVTLYTPDEAGLYRVNGYAVLTNYDPADNFIGVFSFGWTDEASIKTQQIMVGNPVFPAKEFRLYPVSLYPVSQVGSSTSTIFIIRATASTPITVYIANNFGNPPPPSTGNDEFDVFFTIEKL